MLPLTIFRQGERRSLRLQAIVVDAILLLKDDPTLKGSMPMAVFCMYHSSVPAQSISGSVSVLVAAYEQILQR